jgi:hypothetical protein
MPFAALPPAPDPGEARCMLSAYEGQAAGAGAAEGVAKAAGGRS